MATKIAQLSSTEDVLRAGPNDPIQMLPVRGNPPMAPPKWLLEALAHAIILPEFIHIHGPTGSGKTATLDALTKEPENWKLLCEILELPYLALLAFPIEMVNYETPGELYARRALKDGQTYDEESVFILAIRQAIAHRKTHYPLIWVREMGRCHSPAVQHGLLNLMTSGYIPLAGGEFISGEGIAWVADSNYHVEATAAHTMVPLDDALAARFGVNITCDYLSGDEVLQVLFHYQEQGYLPPVPAPAVAQAVKLGEDIRAMRSQGRLSSVTPPTMRTYFAYIRMYNMMPHLGPKGVAGVTLLGAASPEDLTDLAGTCSAVFGVNDQSKASNDVGDIGT